MSSFSNSPVQSSGTSSLHGEELEGSIPLSNEDTSDSSAMHLLSNAVLSSHEEQNKNNEIPHASKTVHVGIDTHTSQNNDRRSQHTSPAEYHGYDSISTPTDEPHSSSSTLENPSTPTSTRTPLFKEQLKYCTQIMKTLKRHRDSFPFNQPVDPVALQIPDYFDVIKHPMDFGTITSKLASNSYNTLDEWVADIRLVFTNCFTYNRPDNPVYLMGKNLEKSFDSMMKKMPMGASGPGGPSPAENITTMSNGTHRSSLTEAPRRRTQTNSISDTDSEDLRYALNFIRDFWSKKISPVSWPFLQPVDPVALGIPDYLKIIKTPMDFGTIKRKLESKGYSSAAEFEADSRLVFSNCFLYNAPDSEVVKLCRSLEKMFNEKWANRPSLHTSITTALNTGPYYMESGEENELDEETSTLIAAKTSQIHRLQDEIKELMAHASSRHKGGAKGAGKRRTSAAAAPSSSTQHQHKEGGGASGAQKKQKPALKPLSFEEKRQLSMDINDLPPERLGKVLDIINESMPHLKNEAENGEIELDVDTLSVATLHALMRYVRQCKMSMKGSGSSSSSYHHHHSKGYSEDEEDYENGSDSD